VFVGKDDSIYVGLCMPRVLARELGSPLDPVIAQTYAGLRGTFGLLGFVAALGIGGEWAVGSSLLSETWPKAWRPWIAAFLQMGVNIGVLLASATVYLMADLPPRNVFLVGILPALLVFWIRKHVPEPLEWQRARKGASVPRLSALFGPELRSITAPRRRSALAYRSCSGAS
jgi:MFS family permease